MYLRLLSGAMFLWTIGLLGEAATCERLTKFRLPGVAVSITNALQIPVPAATAAPLKNSEQVPSVSLCRVDGVIDQRTGAEGKRYEIGFAIALPDRWNGRFLFQGGGGLNGRVADPLGAQAARRISALNRGFAVVSTDSGHKGAAFDRSFFRDQEASLNFSFASVGKVTAAAKAIVTQYYGHRASYSYFDGCSTGGREAMLVTQRYPNDYDGVVSGAPAMRTGFSTIGDRWVAVSFNQIAPKDAAGHATSGAFSDDDKKLIVDSLLDVCDVLDGVRDGMIMNTRACKFDPGTIACSRSKTSSCLSSDQVGALRKAFGGPKDSRGNQVYPGFFYDTGINAIGGIPGLLSWGPSPLGPAITATEIDVDGMAVAAGSDPRAALTDTTWTNLSSFSGHGGKLIFYHGVSDPWFSSLDTLDYYRKMTDENGGTAQVSGWSRLFLVPGMGHCSGGAAALDSFDMLTALTDWVEKGIAPDSVVATGKAFPGRSRPLCAYPKHAQYKGQGDPEAANSFECSE